MLRVLDLRWHLRFSHIRWLDNEAELSASRPSLLVFDVSAYNLSPLTNRIPNSKVFQNSSYYSFVATNRPQHQKQFCTKHYGIAVLTSVKIKPESTTHAHELLVPS